MQSALMYIPKYPDPQCRKLIDRLIEAFNGLTVNGFATGMWRNPEGKVISENVYLMECIIPKTPEAECALMEILLQYKEDAEQTSVLYKLNNNPIFLN